MQPKTDVEYKNLLTEVIKKQMVILGPTITLAKARNVKGLTVQDDGTVTNLTGNPQELIQALIDQFVQLSGLIVKKTMEPLFAISQTSTPTAASPDSSSIQDTINKQAQLVGQPVQGQTGL
ncbi:hypothetical protein M1349_04030 [Patescibacteria group bacterium]|nr:hypothetical protein [Patescibacteria group bacterium]